MALHCHCNEIKRLSVAHWSHLTLKPPQVPLLKFLVFVTVVLSLPLNRTNLLYLRVVIFSFPLFWNTYPLDLCLSQLKCHLLREMFPDHHIQSITLFIYPPVTLPNYLSYLQPLSLFEIILFIHWVTDLLIIYKLFTDYLHLSLLLPLTFQKAHSVRIRTLLFYFFTIPAPQ